MTMVGLAESAASADERSDSSEMQPTILVESQSPHGNAVALLEDDGRTVYLYLNYDGDEGPVRPVWVANGVAAPVMLDPEPMRRGEPPINPVEYCAHPKGMGPFDLDKLELVWLPEGDGVAVYEGRSPHTVPCRELEAVGYAAVGLLPALESNYPVELPPFDGDPVTLLWMVPISAQEHARAKADGTYSVLSGVRLPRPFDMDKAPKLRAN